MLENTTILDKKALIALNVTLYKRSILPMFVIVELAIAGLLLMNPASESPEIHLIFLILLILFPVMIGLTAVFSVRRIYKSDKIVQSGTTVHFAFLEDAVEIDSKNAISESKAKIAYSMINKALVSKTHVFLFHNVANAFVLDMTTFVGGTPQDLIALLKKNGVKIK